MTESIGDILNGMQRALRAEGTAGIEAAFRRGYQQGFEAGDGASLGFGSRAIARLANEIALWRERANQGRMEPPPAIGADGKIIVDGKAI